MATVFHTAASLDGFLADEAHDYSWVFAYQQDEAGPMSYDAFVASAGAVAMGAHCYELLAQAVAGGMPWPYAMPCWVFTHRSLAVVEGADVRFLSGPVEEHREELLASAGGKDFWIFGGGGLAAQFARAGLLDELVVNFAPLTLGRGQGLFADAFSLELLEVGRNGDFACVRYGVRGPRG